MSFWDSLARSSMKDNGSKTEFLGGIQVYLENFYRVMVHQNGQLAQSLPILTKEVSSWGVGGPSFVLET